MLDHIIAHSSRVRDVATFIAEKLKGHRINLNLDLIRASAMLHDVTKTRSITTGERHASTGARLLKTLGYPEVGSIVGQHVLLENYDVNESPSEADIVNYSDKRVLHADVVTLNERMTYIMDRYGNNEIERDRIRTLREYTNILEAKIFSYLHFNPDDLVGFFNGKPH